MNIRFLGAARTVTGSCFMIESQNALFAVDCGMHQGNAEIEKRNLDMQPYRASELDFILLSHAHIDHSGLLPRLMKYGFRGKVYCTTPTLDLASIMLEDSAYVQQMESEWINRKRARRADQFVDPLYTAEDARAVLATFRPVNYNDCFELASGVEVCFRDAGHILGSSFLELAIRENGETVRLVFSGDLGRPNALIVDDPEQPEKPVDCLFMESTYGDRDHKEEDTSRHELAEAVNYSLERGEKTIIPAFAVERSQEIIYALFLLQQEGRIPSDIPVFLDSPLAIKATEIFRRHPAYADQQTKKWLEKGVDPLQLPGLKYTLRTSESQAINETKGPGIVISASGMCNAGRIKHHLRHNLWRPGASVVFVGYQAIGTPGRKIVDGAKKITILGEEIHVAARIFTIGGFSGHAGQSQILEWLRPFARPDLNMVLLHGDPRAQAILAELLRERYSIIARIPDYLDELTITPGATPLLSGHSAPPPEVVNWQGLVQENRAALAALEQALGSLTSKPWAEQVELRDQLRDLNAKFTRLLGNG